MKEVLFSVMLHCFNSSLVGRSDLDLLLWTRLFIIVTATDVNQHKDVTGLSVVIEPFLNNVSTSLI